MGLDRYGACKQRPRINDFGREKERLGWAVLGTVATQRNPTWFQTSPSRPQVEFNPFLSKPAEHTEAKTVLMIWPHDTWVGWGTHTSLVLPNLKQFLMYSMANGFILSFVFAN